MYEKRPAHTAPLALLAVLLCVTYASSQTTATPPQMTPAPNATPVTPKPIPREDFFELQSVANEVDLITSQINLMKERQQTLQLEMNSKSEHYRTLFAQACKSAGVDLAKCKPGDIKPVEKPVEKPAEKK